MSEHTAENDRAAEIEDLWWFRGCIEHLVEGADANDTIRVGTLRAVLETTRPLTSHTNPRVIPPGSST